MCFHREAAPSDVVAQVRSAEALGFEEFWVIEDCFYTAGVSLAATALAVTNDISVGIGIMPAVARNPAITAMEIATLSNLAPGRFHAGIGHGVQEWMEQIGDRKASPLTVLDETITAVRSLLRGETVTVDGRYVTMTGVTLTPPPTQVPPVSAGVRGPKSLELSGRTADGTILADFCSPEYVRRARKHIAAGASTPAAAADHRVTVFASLALDPIGDGSDARMAMSYHLADVLVDAPISLRMAPFYDELAERAAATGWLAAVQGMPAEWWPQIAPVGTAEDCAAYVNNLAEAGADAIAMFPNPDEPIEDAETVTRLLRPLL